MAGPLVSAFLWLGAFSLATGVFFSAALLFRNLPPTDPVAVGLVTIERASKLKDYLGAAIFMTLVPLLTVWFRSTGGRIVGDVVKRYGRRHRVTTAILSTAPLLLSPLFSLTTAKVGWILILPLVLSWAAPRTLHAFETHRWLRELFARTMRPYHALLLAEALSWIVFRYLATGRRIAHYPTLFLEALFVAVFLALFWAVAVYASRLASLLFGTDAKEVFRRITCGGLPMLLLPLFGIVFVPVARAAAFVGLMLVSSALLAMRMRTPFSPSTAWRLAAWVLFPALIYGVSYASTAELSQWVDLFHRGESIGPASDYLRGKVPYRDVFALHGMLEDGLLDAWLMQFFGRSLDVAVTRTVVLGAFLAVSLWYLGIAVFRSIPLALLVVAMGALTTAENNRTFFQVAAAALFWAGAKGRRPFVIAISGAVAAVALFFSFDIGLYTIAGALGAAILLAVAQRRVPWDGVRPMAIAIAFAGGFAAGALPFVLYLVSRGAWGAFLDVTFVAIPSIIDAVWSIPFPDLLSTFRSNLNIHALADFIVWEKFHLIVSPLTIAIAVIHLMARWTARRMDDLDHALLVLTVFAAIAQRSALGRAEFRHQYFAAFLIGPVLVILLLLLCRRLGGIWREGGYGERAFVSAIVGVFAAIAAALFWVPDLLNWRIDDLVRYESRVSRRLRDGKAEEVAWRIRAVSNEIRALTGPRDTIFDFSNQPAFYFFADRANPTRFYQVPILSPRRFQAETIAALERAKPKVVLRTSPEGFDAFDGVPNALRAQAVAAYIDDNYRFHRIVRGVEIWTRVPSARPRPAEAYLREIRLPTKQELVSSGLARFVFPIAGSIEGAGGAHWVSDVTLHNPFRDPIDVRLRYVSATVRADRALRLAARQTVRWPDMVKTFFGAPETLGTLWVEHRAGRAPAMVVKTWDDARGARPSVETPLSHRDAASAGADHAELTIIGIPGSHGEGRRVNVGVVNLGLIPGTFRITVRARSGAQIGRAVESGVPEGELWLVTDLETAAGAKIDESTTVRVTAIAGTGVAFATAVEPDGESEFIPAIPAQQP